MKQLPVFTALTILLAAGPMGIVAAEAAGPVRAIGVENEYADVISQIGGKYVRVQAIETDPNTDPHTFEASPKIAQADRRGSADRRERRRLRRLGGQDHVRFAPTPIAR